MPSLTSIAILAILAMSTSALATDTAAKRPKALVYRGSAACDGCPESVGRLLETSRFNFEVIYAGPNEAVKINADSLKDVEIYAQAGGPDLNDAWREVKPFAKDVRQFVANGGRYLGFCLGAYLAGHSPGFKLLPKRVDTDSEIDQHGAQVKHDSDTVIQVDWRFSTGPNAGQTHKERWLYFQEGSVITGIDPSSPHVLATYSSNGDVAATLTPYEKGWVGLVGPHPEATEDWYTGFNVTNPDGVHFDIAHDLVEATMNGGNVTDDSSSSVGRVVNPINQLQALLGFDTKMR